MARILVAKDDASVCASKHRRVRNPNVLIHDVVAKPFTLDDIVAAVARALRE